MTVWLFITLSLCSTSVPRAGTSIRRAAMLKTSGLLQNAGGKGVFSRVV